MKQVFILNPAAGKGAPALRLREQIDAVFAGQDVDICVTDAPGEATALVRSRVMQGNPVRFYACGGDGTLNEVAAGVQGCENAEVACVPCGSANDFVRIFRGANNFLNLSAQAARTRCTDRRHRLRRKTGSWSVCAGDGCGCRL